jgi:hypothetical protein
MFHPQETGGNLATVRVPVIGQRIFKVVENDVGVKAVQFQIGKFVKLIFQSLVAEHILLDRNEQNIACGQYIADDAVVDR